MLDDRIGPSFRQSFPLLLLSFLPPLLSSFPWTIVQRYRIKIFLKIFSSKKIKNPRYIFYLFQQCNEFSSRFRERDYLHLLFLPFEFSSNKTKNSRPSGEERCNYGTGERIFESVDELRGTWPPILGGLESWGITRARLG